MSEHYLLVDTEGNATEVIGEIKIGRAKTNDIILKDSLASRHHATVYVEGNRILIRDEKSVNGTLVNGKQIFEPEVLNDQDQLQFGDEALIVRAPLAQLKTVKSTEIQQLDEHEAGTILKETGEPLGKNLDSGMGGDSTISEKSPGFEDQMVEEPIAPTKKDQRLNIAIVLLVAVMLCVCCISIILIYVFVLRDSSVLFSLKELPFVGYLGFNLVSL